MNNRVKAIFRNIPFMAILAAILLTACGAEQGIEAHKIWMRPAAQGENEAVYFVIHNHASQTDELIAVSSDAAQAVELDESTIIGGVAEMKKLDAVPVEAFAEIKFAPGSYHVMLIGLKQDLNVGDGIEITLHFKNHADIPIEVPVQNILLPEHEGH
jgi:periplasmic copper chaperone A